MKTLKLKFGLSILALTTLSGCATFATNVKGDFSCKAPNGVCAPTGTIDDQALALIQGSSVPDPINQMDSSPVLFPGKGEMVARSNDETLRIVFPAHVGRDGLYHETTAVHAVVKRGAWVKSLNKYESDIRADASPNNNSLADLAERAPMFLPAAKKISSSEDIDNPYVQIDPVAEIKKKVEEKLGAPKRKPVATNSTVEKTVTGGSFPGLVDGGQ